MEDNNTQTPFDTENIQVEREQIEAEQQAEWEAEQFAKARDEGLEFLSSATVVFEDRRGEAQPEQEAGQGSAFDDARWSQQFDKDLFDVDEIRPSQSVLDRNEGMKVPADHDSMCLVCHKSMKTGPGTAWVECVGGALSAYPRDLPRLDPNKSDEWQHGICMGGYMGCFPVGPACAKKIPARYLEIETGPQQDADDAVRVPVDEPGTVEVETAGEFTREVEIPAADDGKQGNPFAALDEYSERMFAKAQDRAREVEPVETQKTTSGNTSEDGPTGPIGQLPPGVMCVTNRGALLLVTGSNKDGTRTQVMSQTKDQRWVRASKGADYGVRVPGEVEDSIMLDALLSIGKRTLEKMCEQSPQILEFLEEQQKNLAPAVPLDDSDLELARKFLGVVNGTEEAPQVNDDPPVEQGPVPHPGDFVGLPAGVVYAAPKERDQGPELQELQHHVDFLLRQVKLIQSVNEGLMDMIKRRDKKMEALREETEKHHKENVRHIDALQRRGKRQRDETDQSFRNAQAQLDAMQTEIDTMREQVEFQRGAGILAEISRLVKQAGY